MITEDNKKILSSMLTQSTPTLFLGAGFSIGSKSKENIMDGTNLKDYIYINFVMPKTSDAGLSDADLKEINSYNLRGMCETLYTLYGYDEGKTLLSEILVKCYSGILPGENKFHLKLTNYPWRNIFTVNIDDLVENIYSTNRKSLFVQNTNKLKSQPDNTTILYKLHGCVKNPKDGFIFAESEYDMLISKKLDAKLNKFVQELQNNDIIFIGARMDEPDIKYYLQVYENAGCKYRTNRIIFVDPYPTLNLKTIVKKLGATLIEAETKEFLDFIDSLNYQPDELQKALITLNYNGIFRLSDIEKTYDNPYESQLYFGNNCSWQDVSDGWIFEIESFKNAITVLDDLIFQNKPVSFLSIYGSFFAGKSCLLKSLGYYLRSKNFEVMEYKGFQLNVNALKSYIEKSPNHDFAFIIDNAAHYYEKLEKLLIWNCSNKRIIILTASRAYYHKRKKYYLIGKSFYEYELSSLINNNDADIIVKKLDEKSHLSFLSSYEYNKRVSYIYGKKNIINLIIDLTYGKISKRIQEEYAKCLPLLSIEEQRFLLELAIFDIMDIEYYPRELFTEQYGTQLNIDSNINVSEIGIVDLTRMNKKGISLRNSLIISNIISKSKSLIPETIINILTTISRYVEEKKSDVWYYIFQCLLKEDMLKKRLKLSYSEINKIFLSIKSEYKDKSYYWLQLGILYQKQNDFVSAYTYLQLSYSIRPKSYQIQHALARNYLKNANNNKNYLEACVAFEEGEKLMKDLINSKDYYKKKAKAFSITSYIAEKIKFINYHNITPSNQDLKYMISSLESVKYQEDEYIENAFASLYYFLKRHNKLGLLKMDMNSPFLKYVTETITVKNIDEYDDPIIEAFN